MKEILDAVVIVFTEQAPLLIVTVSVTLILTQGFNALLRWRRDRRSIHAEWGDHDWLTIDTLNPHFVKESPWTLLVYVLVYFRNHADVDNYLQSTSIEMQSAGARVIWPGRVRGYYKGQQNYENIEFPLLIEAHGEKAICFCWEYDVVQLRNETYAAIDFMREMQSLPIDFRVYIKYHIRAAGRGITRTSTKRIPFREALLYFYESYLKREPSRQQLLNQFREVFKRQ